MPDMLVRLYDLPDVAPMLAQLKATGIIIRHAMPYEKHLVLDWIRTHFSQDWASEADVAFANQPVSCLIATEAGSIVGFACYEATCRCYFGPTGVMTDKRGRGIGKALLFAAMRGLANIGYAYAIIGSAGPVDFYARTLGAPRIADSWPGIYRDRLKKEDKRPAPHQTA